MKNFFKNKFDFVVSIGQGCACTSYLRRCNLQNYSYPFDWIAGPPMSMITDYIVNGFQDFLNMEDLEPFDPGDGHGDKRTMDLYRNKRNNYHHFHDFPLNTPLEESFEMVKEKYDRRIKRFYENIDSSKKILFVWFSHFEPKEDKDFIDSCKRLRERFSDKEIYMLAIENNSKKREELFEDGHLLILNYDTSSDDKKHHDDETMGNKTNNLRIFKKIKLKTTFTGKIKRIFYTVLTALTCLIINRELRQKIKAKLNMLFYHAKL